MGLIFLAIFFALATTNFGMPSIPGQQGTPLQARAIKDCSYNVDKNTWVITGNARATAYDYFNGKKWILVKKNVNIPAYKVISGARYNEYKREMDKVGTVTDATGDHDNALGKAYFINLGHCNPADYFGGSPEDCVHEDPLYPANKSGPTSRDPMSTVIVFVVKKEGVLSYGSPQPAPAPLPTLNPTEVPVPQKRQDNTWTFDVYLNEELLKANAQDRGVASDNYNNSDVPCWLAQCRGGDLRINDNQAGIDPFKWNYSCSRLQKDRSGTPVPTPKESEYVGGLEGGLSPNEAFPPSFIRKDWVVRTVPAWPSEWGNVQDVSWLAGKRTDLPSTTNPKLAGTVGGKLGSKEEIFNVYADQIPGGPPFADGRLYLEPTFNKTGFYYVYLPTTSEAPASDASSLKLGTFSPNLGVTYQWWYPSCKPVVYFYPEKQTSFDVTLRPFGILTKSNPSYPWFGGWKNVLAEPDGKLTYKGENYDYLYYEGKAFYVKVPQSGFVVKGYELADFFDAILPKLGLIDKEIADFKQYWLARLNEPERFYFIGILPQEEIERVEPMELNPKPDTLIRVRLFFKKLENPQLFALPQIPQTPVRKGTTVVDWGGFYKE